MRRIAKLMGLLVIAGLFAGSSFAQEGKLKVKVTPSQAYVYIDGKPTNHEGSRTLSLPAGKHSLEVANYGFKVSKQDVNIDAGKTTSISVSLEAVGAPVNGPWGRVYLGGTAHAAVTSNGTSPGYHVGHVDEFNNDFIWKQELILPVGKQHLTVRQGDKTVWEGDVDVQANKKISVDMSSNKQKVSEWKRGAQLKDLARFKAGIASATVAVAPVSGNFSASPTQINCSQPSTLTWQSAETVDANISNVGPVATSGSQTVSPRATTTYEFTATGPGGRVHGSSTINVNIVVTASLTANPPEVHYRQIGEKVITNETSTLSWQTSNADSVTLDGNKVDLNGSQTVSAKPADTTPVPEGGAPRTGDEAQTHSLTGTNVCGGTNTVTAPLHVVYSVEPIPTVVLQSIFYPTDYPDKRHPQVGLVKSQQLELANTAAGFKKYLEYDPDAKLSVEAFADIRGGKSYNQDLSERRVERIKQYLVEQGIPADKVQTAAYGKERPLEKKVVKDLESTNPNTPPKARLKNVQADWLAYNRRADIVLMPSGKKSAQFFPHSADDSGIIWQVPKPGLKKVEKAE